MKLSVKIAGITAAFAFALTAVTPASAQTAAELQALIAQLQAQIAALSGGTTATSTTTFTYTRDLTLGSTGADVIALQTFLESKGQLMIPAGVAKGYFGALTQAALAKYQANHMIMPAVGYFGPITRAKVTAEGAIIVPGTPGTPSNPGTPAGLSGQGTVNEMTVGSPDESEMNEGDSNVEIYAVDVELDDNGDLMVQSVDVWFAENDAAGSQSTKPWDYFSEVSLMVDGKEVASMDADSSSDWSSVTNGNISTAGSTKEYRIRFTGLDFVMESDETTVISVAVSSLNNIDSDDDNAVWDIDLGNVRVVDGTGFIVNEDFNVADSFTVNSSAEEADITIRDSNDSPEASVIEVDKTNDTNNVTIYGFEIEEDNNVDLNIEEMTLTFLTTTSAAGALNENVIIKRAYLYQGSTKVGDESMTTNGVVVFDNMDIDIDGDSKEEFTVRVDLEDTNNGARYAEGALISVDITSIDLFTDSNGNDEGDLTASISGGSDEHELRTEGIMVDLVSTDAKITSAGDPATATSTDKGTFKIVFDVTSFGADQRLDKTSAEGVAATAVAGQGVLFSTTADTVITSSLTSSTTDTEDNANVFELDENQTRRFTLTVVAESTDDLAKVVLETLNFGTATGDTNASFYTFNLDEFKTDELFLNTY